MHTPKRLDTRTHAYTHTDKYIIFIAFLRQQLFANAPHCYVTRTLSVLFIFKYTHILQTKHPEMYESVHVARLTEADKQNYDMTAELGCWFQFQNNSL